MKIKDMYATQIVEKNIKVVIGAPVLLGVGGKVIGKVIAGKVLKNGKQEVSMQITDTSVFKDIQNAVIGSVLIGSSIGVKAKNKS